MENKQLVQKNCNTGAMGNIYPKTVTSAVIDPVTDKTLDTTLEQFNHIYLPFTNSRANTRLQIADNLRRKGLWITYVTCKGSVITEWYNSDDFSDEAWGNKNNWVLYLESNDVDLDYLKSTIGDIYEKVVNLETFKGSLGQPNGIAQLDGSGKVPSSQLPSYVDDVIEFESKEVFPESGEEGKIYVDLTSNLTYRWSGTTYVEISPSIALGETSATAYAGDKGKRNAEEINNIKRELAGLTTLTPEDTATLTKIDSIFKKYNIVTNIAQINNQYTNNDITFGFNVYGVVKNSSGIPTSSNFTFVSHSIPTASTDRPGLLSHKHYNVLNNLAHLDKKGVLVYNEDNASTIYGENGVTLPLNYINVYGGLAKEYSLTIENATQERVGLMSVEDKTILDSLPDTILSLSVPGVSDGIDVITTDYDAYIYFPFTQIKGSDSSTINHTLVLPSADRDNAGLLSAYDKKKLDNIDDFKLDALNNIPIEGDDRYTILNELYNNGFVCMFDGTGPSDNGGLEIRYYKVNNFGAFSLDSIKIPVASNFEYGVMSPEDRLKLDSIDLDNIGGGSSIDFGNKELLFAEPTTYLLRVNANDIGIHIEYPVFNTNSGSISTITCNIPAATADSYGVMSASDKAKLDSITSGGIGSSELEGKKVLLFTDDGPIAEYNDNGTELLFPYQNVGNDSSIGIYSFPIENASAEHGGLMSIADKTKLSNLPDTVEAPFSITTSEDGTSTLNLDIITSVDGRNQSVAVLPGGNPVHVGLAISSSGKLYANANQYVFAGNRALNSSASNMVLEKGLSKVLENYYDKATVDTKIADVSLTDLEKNFVYNLDDYGVITNMEATRDSKDAPVLTLKSISSHTTSDGEPIIDTFDITLDNILGKDIKLGRLNDVIPVPGTITKDSTLVDAIEQLVSAVNYMADRITALEGKANA